MQSHSLVRLVQLLQPWLSVLRGVNMALCPIWSGTYDVSYVVDVLVASTQLAVASSQPQ